jgi:hypothetical protein
MSTLQSAHQYGETSWTFEVGEESPSIQTQRAEGRKAKKVKKYYGTCAFCSKEFVCESKNQKYCRHECYAEHTAIKKANPYKNLECITCLSILGFGCKTIAKKLYKVSHVTARKIILERQLPQSNSKRAAIRKVESSVRPMSDSEKRKREQIKEADKVLKKIQIIKNKYEMINKAQKNCPYDFDWRQFSWSSVLYWANIERYRGYARKSAKKRQIVKGSHNHMKRICSSMIWRAIKLGYVKKQKTMHYFGCTTEELKAHLQSKFQPGMTWDNHGEAWEVDHIVPCDSFDLTNDYQVRLCNHYTNLQPLMKHLNRRKHAKFSGATQLQIL